MSTFAAVRWILALVTGAAALYGLHRLALRLEERGHLYYVKKKPRGSAAGSFVALQRAIEPRAQHVLVVREEASRDAGLPSGPDAPPAAAGDEARGPR